MWKAIAARQGGVVTGAQLVDAGCTASQIAGWLESGRWTRLHRGVYVVFTGPVPPITRVWAALLAAGPDAAVGGETALWLDGLPEARADPVTICLPWERQTFAVRGARVVRCRDLADRVHPVARPRRLRIEDALLDVTDACAAESAVVAAVFRVAPDRRTHPERIRRAMARRRRLRHRRLLADLLGEVAEGVLSALERRFRQRVERPHGLPAGRRNEVEVVRDERGRRARNRYRDLRYLGRRVVVELDGAGSHPVWLRHLDHKRDNSATLAGAKVLQFDWFAVVDDPCAVARDIALLLWQEGWRGVPTPCSPTCPLLTLDPHRLPRSG